MAPGPSPASFAQSPGRGFNRAFLWSTCVVRRRRAERRAHGHDARGITAVGLPEGLPISIDRGVMDRDRSSSAAGAPHCEGIAPPAFLAILPGAEVVNDLTREP